jgi:hypothetical protein
MPKLEYLSLVVGEHRASAKFGTVFKNLLPQITSLALANEPPEEEVSEGYLSIHTALPLMRSLSHLALKMFPSSLFGVLYSSSCAVTLETLHIRVMNGGDYADTCVEIAAWRGIGLVARGVGHIGFRVKRVYLYGDKDNDINSCSKLYVHDPDWRMGEVPFSDFDGTPSHKLE